ncbi:MAG: DUF748 domain-containing protein, partial [Candidatus Methylumidiphilus sp.]
RKPLAAIRSLAADNFSYAPHDGQLGLERLRVEAIDLKTPSPIVSKDGKPHPSRIEFLGLTGLSADTTIKTVQIAYAQGSQAELAVWRNPDGTAGFSGLPPPAAAQATDPKPAASAPPWRIKLGRVDLRDNTLRLRDFSADPPTKVRLANLDVLVKEFDSAANQTFWLGINTGLSSKGHIALEGRVGLAPASASLKMAVDDLSLPPFQPYLDKSVRVRMVNGALNMDAFIDYAAGAKPKLQMGGDVRVVNFVSEDTQEGRDFVNWTELRLNGLILESAPQRLSIKEIIATEPYARVILAADKTLNIAENLSPPPTATENKSAAPAPAAPAPAQAAPPTPLLIGALQIRRGKADFADMTVQPSGFAARIRGLNGTIRGLSSQQDAKSDVLLEGRLNRGSAVRIFGKANPFSLRAYADLNMRFSNVDLTTLSPYAAKFAGYRIEKGKLNMDLRYQLNNGQLTAENNFMLDQLELGERVDSPDATSLPVRMAVALMKDADGKIDISLPVTGDLNNPNVSVRGLLAAAAGQLLAKVATSPLSLLGSLLGHGGTELETVKFDPGAAALATSEKDKLATIVKALQSRPRLSLDIRGAADAELDRPALAEADLARQLKNARLIELGRKKSAGAEWDGVTLSDEDYGRLLTNFCRWKDPKAAELQALKNGESLQGDLLANVKRRLLANWKVSEIDLRGLAQSRGEAVRRYLVKEMGLADQRIYLLDVKLGKQEAKEIKVMLSLNGL